jgi:hypothetical protein
LPYPIALLTAFGPAYQSPPNGSASEIRSTPRLFFTPSDFMSVHIHFLRNAAASFLTTHRSNTQISHNAIRNPTTGSSNPMSFQKDLAPPGIYDGASAIAKSTS